MLFNDDALSLLFFLNSMSSTVTLYGRKKKSTFTLSALDKAISIVLSGIIIPFSYFEIDCFDTILLIFSQRLSIDRPFISLALLSRCENICFMIFIILWSQRW